MNKKRNKFNLILAVCWTITGILVLIAGPTRFTYALCCITLVINYLVTYICGDANYNEGFHDGALDAIDRCRKIVEEVCEKKKEKKQWRN